MKMVIILVILLDGMVWWYDDVQLNDDTWVGEWEWSNQGTIPHRFTTRWHFSEDVIIISPPWLLSQAIIMCVALMYTWNRSRWIFHLNSRSWSGTRWVFYALRGFEGGLPPHPFTVMPATPNIWMPHPPNLYTATRLYYIPASQTCKRSSLAQPQFSPRGETYLAYRFDLGKIGSTLSVQSRSPFSSLNSQFT